MLRTAKSKRNFEDDEFETEAFQFMNTKKPQESDEEEGNASLSDDLEDESDPSEGESGSDDNQLDVTDDNESDDGSDDSDEEPPVGHDDSDDDSDGEVPEGSDGGNNEAPVGNDNSDDEAPEAVNFSESRKNILTQLRTAMMQVDQEKQKRKEKRKQQEILFKEQKEKKKKYIKDTKLSEDILEDIDEVIPKNASHRKKLEKEKQKTADLSQSTTENVKEKEGSKKAGKGHRVTFHPAGDFGEDYIPFVDESSGVEVVEIKQYEKQHKSLAQKAADFRNSRLYSKDIPRESNKSRLLKLEKKRQRLK